MPKLLTPDQAVLRLRSDPAYSALVRDAYLGEDVVESARRFLTSAEFGEVRKLLGTRIQGSVILDVGAGNGIASYSFAACGARSVYALEPDSSNEIGRGAILRLT